MSRGNYRGRWTIYALIDPRDRMVRYVGITCYTMERRIRQHRSRSGQGNGAKGVWLRGLNEDGLAPIAHPIAEVLGYESDAQRAECLYTKFFLERGHHLLNGETKRSDMPSPSSKLRHEWPRWQVWYDDF